MSVNLVGVSLCIWVNSENFRGRVSAFPLPRWLPKGQWSFKTLVSIMWIQLYGGGGGGNGQIDPIWLKYN